MIEQLQQSDRQARNFWHDWQSRADEWAVLDGVEFVDTANELLAQYFPEIAVELEGSLQSDVRRLVFTAHGEREEFPAVQALAATAPQLDRFTVCAFRQPIIDGDRHDFGIGMNGFDLNAVDVLVRLDTWREMPALEMAFAKPIPPEFAEHAQNMAVIIMDHIVGEWSAAVKIDALDFMPQEGEGWFSITRLPEALDEYWRDLGRSGRYPEPEWAYANAEVEGDDEQDHLLLVRNQSAATLIGRADMAWTVSVSCRLSGSADLERAYELQDQFEAHAVLGQAGIPTLTVTNLTQGERTVYAVTSEPLALAEAAAGICARFADLDARTEVDYDPSWAHYRC